MTEDSFLLSLEIAQAIGGQPSIQQKTQKVREKKKPSKNFSYQIDGTIVSVTREVSYGVDVWQVWFSFQEDKTKEGYLHFGECSFQFSTREDAHSFIEQFYQGDKITCIITKGEK